MKPQPIRHRLSWAELSDGVEVEYGGRVATGGEEAADGDGGLADPTAAGEGERVMAQPVSSSAIRSGWWVVGAVGSRQLSGAVQSSQPSANGETHASMSRTAA